MHLESRQYICYVYMHSKIYVTRKTKTINNLESEQVLANTQPPHLSWHTRDQSSNLEAMYNLARARIN